VTPPRDDFLISLSQSVVCSTTRRGE
jgi:hypothetical protein